MDKIDNALLTRIQKEFPINRNPFKALGEFFNLSEDETLQRIKTLKDEKQIIRTISPIFDGSKLGYKTALIALKVTPFGIEEIAEKINIMNGVSHNYQRDNEYNLWFTLAIKQEKSFDKIVSKLCKENNVDKYLILPSIKTFKLNTSFNLSDKDRIAISESIECCQQCGNYILDNIDKLIINVLQADLSLELQPFDAFADQVKIDINDFIRRSEILLANGFIRRYCASIKHVNVGINYNAMVVWQVEDDLLEIVGRIASAETFVSHCYNRESFSEWPYNFYTMIHATDEEKLYSYIDKLDTVINSTSKKILRTIKEYKKTRTLYLV